MPNHNQELLNALKEIGFDKVLDESGSIRSEFLNPLKEAVESFQKDPTSLETEGTEGYEAVHKVVEYLNTIPDVEVTREKIIEAISHPNEAYKDIVKEDVQPTEVVTTEKTNSTELSFLTSAWRDNADIGIVNTIEHVFSQKNGVSDEEYDKFVSDIYSRLDRSYHDDKKTDTIKDVLKYVDEFKYLDRNGKDIPKEKVLTMRIDYDTKMQTYKEGIGRYGFRNAFELTNKLEADIAAFKLGLPGTNGSQITGATLFTDSIGLLRTNFLESILTVAICTVLEVAFPSLVDLPHNVVKNEVEKDSDHIDHTGGITAPEKTGLLSENGIYRFDSSNITKNDDGKMIVTIPENIKEAILEARKTEPTAGTFIGYDLTDTDKMRVTGNGRFVVMESDTGRGKDPVTGVRVPGMRLVIDVNNNNVFLVPPVGDVIKVDVKNEDAANGFIDNSSKRLQLSDEDIEKDAKGYGKDGYTKEEYVKNIVKPTLEVFADSRAENLEKISNDYQNKIDETKQKRDELISQKSDLETYKVQLESRTDDTEKDQKMAQVEGALESISNAITDCDKRLDRLIAGKTDIDNIRASLSDKGVSVEDRIGRLAEVEKGLEDRNGEPYDPVGAENTDNVKNAIELYRVDYKAPVEKVEVPQNQEKAVTAQEPSKEVVKEEQKDLGKYILEKQQGPIDFDAYHYEEKPNRSGRGTHIEIKVDQVKSDVITSIRDTFTTEGKVLGFDLYDDKKMRMVDNNFISIASTPKVHQGSSSNVPGVKLVIDTRNSNMYLVPPKGEPVTVFKNNPNAEQVFLTDRYTRFQMSDKAIQEDIAQFGTGNWTVEQYVENQINPVIEEFLSSRIDYFKEMAEDIETKLDSYNQEKDDLVDVKTELTEQLKDLIALKENAQANGVINQDLDKTIDQIQTAIQVCDAGISGYDAKIDRLSSELQNIRDMVIPGLENPQGDLHARLEAVAQGDTTEQVGKYNPISKEGDDFINDVLVNTVDTEAIEKEIEQMKANPEVASEEKTKINMLIDADVTNAISDMVFQQGHNIDKIDGEIEALINQGLDPDTDEIRALTQEREMSESWSNLFNDIESPDTQEGKMFVAERLLADPEKYNLSENDIERLKAYREELKPEADRVGTEETSQPDMPKVEEEAKPASESPVAPEPDQVDNPTQEKEDSTSSDEDKNKVTVQEEKSGSSGENRHEQPTQEGQAVTLNEKENDIAIPEGLDETVISSEDVTLHDVAETIRDRISQCQSYLEQTGSDGNTEDLISRYADLGKTLIEEEGFDNDSAVVLTYFESDLCLRDDIEPCATLIGQYVEDKINEIKERFKPEEREDVALDDVDFVERKEDTFKDVELSEKTNLSDTESSTISVFMDSVKETIADAVDFLVGIFGNNNDVDSGIDNNDNNPFD